MSKIQSFWISSKASLGQKQTDFIALNTVSVHHEIVPPEKYVFSNIVPNLFVIREGKGLDRKSVV